MTNTIDFTAAYNLHQQRLVHANQANKETVFNALAAAGITSVRVDFDGESDSGQINNVCSYADVNPSEIPSVNVSIQLASWEKQDMEVAQSTLLDAIETLCYDALSVEHGGWENNDGAFGEFVFNVEQRIIELEFNGRFSDFVTSHHTF